MYIPPHFASKDEERIHNLIRQDGFATVLSFPANERPFINHIPVTLEDSQTLIGHMAKRNPQWTHFKDNPSCTLIIHGPHTYVTPSWYQSGRDVPTWNYAIVHLHGKIELIEKFEDQIEVLKKLTEFFEAKNEKPWEFELPADLMDGPALTSAIISFRFRIEEIETKFKLSQNRPNVDRAGIIAGLAERSDDDSRLIKEMMQENETLR